MSDFEVIDTVSGESENLKLHVDICAQRYGQLINKFDQVDDRLDKIELTLEQIHESLNKSERSNLNRYLAWAGVIITTLIGVVVALALR